MYLSQGKVDTLISNFNRRNRIKPKAILNWWLMKLEILVMSQLYSITRIKRQKLKLSKVTLNKISLNSIIAA